MVFFGLTALLGLSILAAVSKIGHMNRYKPGKFSLVLALLLSRFILLLSTMPAT